MKRTWDISKTKQQVLSVFTIVLSLWFPLWTTFVRPVLPNYYTNLEILVSLNITKFVRTRICNPQKFRLNYVCMYMFIYMYLLLLSSYNEYRATDLKISKFFLKYVFNEVQFLRPCSSVGVDIITYNLNNLILSAFAKLRRATLIFVISVQPAVCSHRTTSFRLDGFS